MFDKLDFKTMTPNDEFLFNFSMCNRCGGELAIQISRDLNMGLLSGQCKKCQIVFIKEASNER